ncbi:DNA methyltransferase, partial [Listeria booriae]|nr:DNA methyltransferase [Listeria booriae]
MMRTAELEMELNITRQSLQNYIRQGEIERPKKDNKGYLWLEQNIEQVKNIVELKSENQRHVLSSNKKLEIQNRLYLGSK